MKLSGNKNIDILILVSFMLTAIMVLIDILVIA